MYTTLLSSLRFDMSKYIERCAFRKVTVRKKYLPQIGQYGTTLIYLPVEQGMIRRKQGIPTGNVVTNKTGL